MVSNDESKSCVKCRRVVNSTDKVLVCGLWCKKYFHNHCVGLTNSETRAVKCSKERIKFHCENCENRLGTELTGKKETQGSNKLDCVNNCLLEFAQKILEVTNKLSDDNSVINTKLDTVISSNARLEEYILQSPKCFEKRNAVTIHNSVEHVESFPGTQIIENNDENNEKNSENTTLNGKQICCTSKPQETDINSSSLHIASDVAKHLSHCQPPDVMEESSSNVTEECSSNCLRELEVPAQHYNVQDPVGTNKEECSPSEDVLVHSDISIEQTEYQGDEENAGGDADIEECSPSEDFLLHSDISIEKTEIVGGEEKAEGEIDMEECSPSKDFLVHSDITMEKTEFEGGEEKAEGEIDMEECSSSEDFLRNNTFSIEKAEDDEGGEAVGDDSFEEIKHEVESTSNGNEPESIIVVGTKDKRNQADSSNLVTKDSQAAGQAHKIQCTSKEDMSCGNKSGTSCMAHKGDICKKTFTNSQELKERTNLNKCKLRHSCKMCHKTFMSIKSLGKHFQKHIRECQNVCNICNKTFTCSNSLMDHFRLHNGDTPYSCCVCNKKLKNKVTMNRHLTLHSGERPYSCSVCNMRFTRKDTLVQHSRLHTGERPYSCSVCNKTFTLRKGLVEHSRLHTGERPYSCSVCNKAFVQRSHLVSHSKRHTSKLP